jgi:hypothetical protein
MKWLHYLLMGLIAFQLGLTGAWATEDTFCSDSTGSGHCDDPDMIND